jgi:poly(3-hydroxybutyrate) depolymerase
VKLFKALFLLFGLFAACSQNGTQIDQYAERKVNFDGKEYPYRVLVPAQRDPNAKLPVLLYLHGSGSRGHENREQAWAFAAATESVRDKMNFIVVLPQCRENTFWSSGEMSRYALAALDQSVEEFNGDPQRLYFAGFFARRVRHMANCRSESGKILGPDPGRGLYRRRRADRSARTRGDYSGRFENA